MNSRFARTLKIVAVAHVGIVAGYMAFSAIRHVVSMRREQVVPVSLVIERSEPVAPQVAEPEPAPRREEPEPEPEPAARERRRIEVSDRVVERRTERNRPKPPSPEEIRRILAGERRNAENRDITDEERCMEIVRRTLRSAWVQPSVLESGDAVVRASILLDMSGKIVDRQLVGRSGNAAMDDSVRNALFSVDRIAGLSDSFLRRREPIIIAFRVKDE